MTLTWDEVSARLGRNDYPRALAEAVLVHGDLTDPAEIAKGVEAAWTMCEWPSRAMDADLWAILFTDGVPPKHYREGERNVPHDDLPEELVLYRGADRDHRLGASWSADRDRALWFARRWDAYDQNHTHGLYTVTLRGIDRWAVLAHYLARGNEDEYVLDVECLDDEMITEIPREEW